MKSHILLSLALVMLCFIAPPASAQFEAGDWGLTLTGSGASSNDFDSNAFSLTVAPSYFVSHNLELGFRQTLTFFDSEEGGSGFAGSTAVAVDVNFTLSDSIPKLVLFAGGSVGYQYGDGVDDGAYIAPEVGLKYFVTTDAYLYGAVAYRFDLNDGWNEGDFVYSVGIGLRL